VANPRLQQVLEGLQSRYRPAAIDREIVYYLSLGEDPGDKWTVTLTPSGCSMVAGRVGTAHCVLKTSADLFMKMIDGSYQPNALDFMRGKLKTNDLYLLLRLRKAFGIQ
jgi:long-chain acyl-CoA synthetase